MKLLLLIALGLVAAQAEQSQVLKDFSAGYNQFTGNVYKELLKTHSGNFLVSPISAETILALSTYAAKEKTFEELAAGLHLPANKDKIKELFQSIAPHLKGNDKYTLTTANKIYLNHGFKIESDFEDVAKNVFKAGVENIDFLKKEEAAATVNKWISDETHDKIKDVVKKDDLSEDTRALLINTMYFHGNWKTKFNEKHTTKKAFYSNKQTQADTDMMEITTAFRYYESPELKAQFVELPYDGDDITMIFVLPTDVEGLPALEARIAEVIEAPKFNIDNVHLVVPKFKIESTIEFKPILQALGIHSAFGNSADFGGLSAEPTYIEKVIQKGFIEVEEKGTTAAVATVVFPNSRSGHKQSFPPREFIANHPFIYYVKGPAGVMFIGRYVRP